MNWDDQFHYYFDCLLEAAPGEEISKCQELLLEGAIRIAGINSKPHLQYFTLYVFRDMLQHTELEAECDLLDASPEKIAIECYLYEKSTRKFIAKSFSIFSI